MNHIRNIFMTAMMGFWFCLLFTPVVYAQQLPGYIMQSAEVQEAIKSGQMTPQQRKYIQSGKVPPQAQKEVSEEKTRMTPEEREAFQREKFRPATLTPDEIEVGRRFLEEKKRAAFKKGENFVFLRGNVRNPGRYDYKPGMRVLDLIPDQYSLYEDTYFDYALIKRSRFGEEFGEDEKKYEYEKKYEDEKWKKKDAFYSMSETGKRIELIPFDLGRLLFYMDKDHNIFLIPGDEVYIYKTTAIESAKLAEEEKAELPPERTFLQIYGHKFFSAVPSTFAPITSVPVSKSYIIGPGDEIRILMWGRLDADYKLEVDSEGMIYFPKIGPLAVAGLSFGETRELIIRKAEAITGVNVSVSMGKLRVIQVFVLGEVKSPGLYTVSSLATVTNALLSSGGPTPLGSLRKVQLKRQGKVVTTIDFYNFQLQGDTSSDTRLMPGDVIFIPQAGPMVSITGNVKRPAIYELKDQKSLRSAIKLAGGLKPDAFKQRIQIERAFENKEQIVLDIPFDELQKRKAVSIQDGDLIRIFPIIPLTVNAVYLYGNVLQPGPREFKPGIRLLDIIPDFDSLDKDTYLDYGLIKRYRRDEMKAELISFNLGQLLLDKNETQNIPLMPRDEVTIFNKSMLQDAAYAEVVGEVRKPGNYFIDNKWMRLKDLILKGGNLTRDAYLGNCHLYRASQDTNEVSILTLNLEKAMAGDPEHNLILSDMDRVIIHSRWEYYEKFTVTIQGLVTNPDEYLYAKNMTVRDLILVAGNVKTAAYLDEAELNRFDIVEGKRVETSILKFNVQRALENEPGHNLKLQPMDVVNIKEIPGWWEKKKSVILSGEVYFPGTYTIRKNERLSDVIERAGGYTEIAYLKGAIFTRESVKIIQEQRTVEMIDRLERETARLSAQEIQGALSPEDLASQLNLIGSQKALIEKLRKVEATGRVVISLLPLSLLKGSASDTTLEEGDTFFIPHMTNTVNVLGAVFNPGAFIFDENRPEIKHYLAKTGGTTNNAEEDQMYVVRVDGSVISKKGGSWFGVSWSNEETRFGFWRSFEKNKMYPGDTIIVPEKMIYPNYMRDVKDITQILYQIAVTAGATALMF